MSARIVPLDRTFGFVVAFPLLALLALFALLYLFSDPNSYGTDLAWLLLFAPLLAQAGLLFVFRHYTLSAACLSRFPFLSVWPLLPLLPLGYSLYPLFLSLFFGHLAWLPFHLLAWSTTLFFVLALPLVWAKRFASLPFGLYFSALLFLPLALYLYASVIGMLSL